MLTYDELCKMTNNSLVQCHQTAEFTNTLCVTKTGQLSYNKPQKFPNQTAKFDIQQPNSHFLKQYKNIKYSFLHNSSIPINSS